MWWKLSVGHHVRHAGRRDHSGAREDLHVDRVGARARGRDLVARGRRVAQHPRGPGRGQFQRLLARPQHRRADEHGLLGQPDGLRRADDCRAGVCVRPRGVRLPRHGAGHDCRRLVRAGHRQRAVGLRAVGHRAAAGHQGGDQARLRLHAGLRERQAPARGERRRRQYVQGHGQARAHRHRRRRLDDDDFFDRGAADRRADAERARISRSFTRPFCWASSRAAR